jgi:uridine phosphorylase
MTPIGTSELILNDRGAVYHLDLLPEEIADTIILVGDPGRVEKVSNRFDTIEYRRQHREFITHTGYVGKKRLTVVSTGIGTANNDITMNELDALVNIDLATRTVREQFHALKFCRFGTSGSLQADIPVDSFMASTYGIGLDNLLNFYAYEKTTEEKEMAQTFAREVGLSEETTIPYIFAGDPHMLSGLGSNFHKGITITCPGFFGPQGRILRLPLQNPGLIDRLTQFRYGSHRISNFEMETSAIFGLGKLLGHPSMSLNVIIANRVRKEFSKDYPAAVEKLIDAGIAALTQSS